MTDTKQMINQICCGGTSNLQIISIPIPTKTHISHFEEWYPLTFVPHMSRHFPLPSRSLIARLRGEPLSEYHREEQMGVRNV